MISKLKKQYRLAKLAYKFIFKEELKSKTTVPFYKRLHLLTKGFHGHTANLYNLKDYVLDDYFSDWAKAKMSMMYDSRNVRAGYQYGLNNKIFSTAIIGQYIYTPKIYAIIERGEVYGLHKDSEGFLTSSWAENCKKAGGRLVFKPSAEGRGRGIFVLKNSDNNLLINNKPISEAEFANMISTLNEYIIVEYLNQGDYSASLFSESVNTIRVVTIIDPDTKKPYMPVAVQRIGRKSSAPVDNWNKGGLCASIEIEKGVLSRAATREGKDRHLSWYDTHPDTGAQIKGKIVDDWESIKSSVLEAASMMAYYKYLSWDVVKLDDGIAVIEGDTISGIETLQVHKPLLTDPIVKKFLVNLGYVKK